MACKYSFDDFWSIKLGKAVQNVFSKAKKRESSTPSEFIVYIFKAPLTIK